MVFCFLNQILVLSREVGSLETPDPSTTVGLGIVLRCFPHHGRQITSTVAAPLSPNHHHHVPQPPPHSTPHPCPSNPPHLSPPLQEEQQSGGVVRANPLPDGGVPFKPIVEHRSTRPAPFSFETRDKQRQAEKERKIQQVRNAWWC